jgi:uncharacterized integral membrane protein
MSSKTRWRLIIAFLAAIVWGALLQRIIAAFMGS